MCTNKCYGGHADALTQGVKYLSPHELGHWASRKAALNCFLLYLFRESVVSTFKQSKNITITEEQAWNWWILVEMLADILLRFMY